MMKRAEALRKCLIVFDALRRVSSKGNAGLEPLEGAEESFETDSEICQVLREWLREMESGTPVIRPVIRTKTDMPQATDSWEYMLQGGPLVTPETMKAAREMDEAREQLIKQRMTPEPNVPVIDMREWQRIAAQKPPERLDFDEDPLE